MTVRLEAISEVDGTGIVRSGEVLRLLRPPYTLQGSPVLSEESLHEAISRFGFSPSREEFPGWEQAIEFLNFKTAESRRALGIELPGAIDGAGVIEAAPRTSSTIFCCGWTEISSLGGCSTMLRISYLLSWQAAL